MEDIKQCPKANCPYLYADGFPSPRLISCALCKTNFCSSCREVHSYSKITCQQYQIELQQLLDEQEKATESWKVSYAKPCPKCKSPIQKNGGCDHMVCYNCKYEFCYQCLSKYYDGHLREVHGPLSRRHNITRAVQSRNINFNDNLQNSNFQPAHTNFNTNHQHNIDINANYQPNLNINTHLQPHHIHNFNTGAVMS